MPILGRRQRFSQKRGRRDGARRTNSSGAKAVDAKIQRNAPSIRTLRWVAFTTGLPFLGFGFMDNAILIIAGDAIDTTLGVTLGISTLCAAAIGNIISDLAGIGCAAYIEEFCATKLKLPVPKLSTAQRQLRSVRTASQGGMAIGMTIGCIFGMIPLFFIDSNKAEKLREKARLERLYKDVLNEAKTLVEAESTILYLRVDKDEPGSNAQSKGGGVSILPDYHPSMNGEYLYAMYYDRHPSNESDDTRSSTTNTLMRMVSSGSRVSPSSINNGSSRYDGERAGPPNTASESDCSDEDDALISTVTKNSEHPSVPKSHPTRVIPVGKGIVSRAVLTGTAWNIAGNLMDEPDFFPLSIKTGGSKEINRERFRDCAVVPILDGRGKVIAVLEAFNKVRQASRGGGFTDQDVEILVSLASHVSVSLQRLYHEEDQHDFELRDTIRILKEGKGIKRSKTRKMSAGEETSGGFFHGKPGDLGTKSDKAIITNGRKKAQLFPDET